MKFIWIYILSCAVVIVTSAPTPGENPPNSEVVDEKPEGESRQETLEDIVDLGNEETDLPILPPIILIDFTNGTNLTSEEKSKRTINGNLGYGFQGNNLFTGKYNYYFPAGKTGTTVSIEESISPFLPTTIIEKIPANNKFYNNQNSNLYSGSGQNNLFTGSSNGQLQSQIRLNNAPSPAYGQRTKLQKTTDDGLRSYSSFSVTPKPNYSGYTTPKPTDFRSNQFASSGLSLGSYANPISNYQSFTTARPSFYNSPVQVRYQPGTNVKTYFGTPGKGYEGFATTKAPPAYNPLSSGSKHGSYNNQRPGLESYSNPKQSQSTVLSALQGNTPRYSYEDGIKYEHKIVWKYPDGMVSEVAPNSYDSSYQEFTSPTKASLQASNYQGSAGSTAANNFPKALNSGYSVNAGSIYSQRPATFPDDGTSGSGESKANQFVSSASISNGGNYFSGSGSQGAPPSQKYSFQIPSYSVNSDGQSGKTQNSPLASSASYKANLNDQTSKYLPSPVVEDPKIVSNYPVDSSEPEYPPLDSYSSAEAYDSSRTNAYTYSQSSSIPSSFGQISASSSSSDHSEGGKISPEILSKYTPQVQQYLKKALGLEESAQRQEYQPSNLQGYSNIQYSNLLNYNPSISQYIRNPSSILNAQPTFVQAGNSLIPVIILRVDGVAPIQPKVTPNINLKALLQRYLTQYAQTVNNLSQGQNFEQSYVDPKGQSAPNAEQFDFNLAQLTQSLGQLRQDSNFKQNFAQNFAQSVAQSTQGYQPSSYSGQSDYSDYKNQDFGSRGLKYQPVVSRETKKPKVKNVEIIDDPRFTSYKVKN